MKYVRRKASSKTVPLDPVTRKTYPAGDSGPDISLNTEDFSGRAAEDLSSINVCAILLYVYRYACTDTIRLTAASHYSRYVLGSHPFVTSCLLTMLLTILTNPFLPVVHLRTVGDPAANRAPRQAVP